MKLGVYWDGREVGQLQRIDERSSEYVFAYTSQASRPISLSLPLGQESFDSAASRPFFEALLPEGAIRDQIAGQLKLAASDSFGLLAELGRDCAGALQIVESSRMSQTPSVQWLEERELDTLVEQIPTHPLGIQRDDEHLRLSLAGVQSKAVLVREQSGRFGRPLDGMPSTHILKPELQDNGCPGLATNECFCMRLAMRCGLSSASVELLTLAGRPCLVVERFDREISSWPPRRLHQEDLCQALGLTPDFKYQHEGWRLPSYQGLAELLSAHSLSARRRSSRRCASGGLSLPGRQRRRTREEHLAAAPHTRRAPRPSLRRPLHSRLPGAQHRARAQHRRRVPTQQDLIDSLV